VRYTGSIDFSPPPDSGTIAWAITGEGPDEGDSAGEGLGEGGSGEGEGLGGDDTLAGDATAAESSWQAGSVVSRRWR
jgi:hypothetical protein